MQPSTYINSDSFFDYLRNDDALITYVILSSNFSFKCFIRNIRSISLGFLSENTLKGEYF